MGSVYTRRNYGIDLNILHICKNGKNSRAQILELLNKFFCFASLEIIFSRLFQFIPACSGLVRCCPLCTVLFRFGPVDSGLCQKISKDSALVTFKTV